MALGQGTLAEEELEMADLRIEALHQAQLLPQRQTPGPLQQIPFQQTGEIPLLRIGEAGELEIGGRHEAEQSLQVVTRLLGVQVHVGEVGIRRRVQGPTLLVVAAQPVILRQIRKQLPAKPQTLLVGDHAEVLEGPLNAVDLPATAVGIQKQMQQPARGQQAGQGGQACFRFAQVMQHPHGVDVIERAFALQLQQAALLDPQASGEGTAAGAPQAFPSHLQGASTDVHRQDLGARIEMGQVIGAHPGAAARIEEPRRRHRQGQAPRAGAEGGGMAPTPVVTGRGTILEGIPWVGEAVVEGAHHGGGGIGGSLGHGGRVVHRSGEPFMLRSDPHTWPTPLAGAAQLQTFVHGARSRLKLSRNVVQPGTRPSMTVTASSGSSRVFPQRYDTLPLSSVRQAEQQDRFPEKGELDTLITFFNSGVIRLEAARRLSANADVIVAKAANRIFAGGTPLSYLDAPLTPVLISSGANAPLAADQLAAASSVRTFAQGIGGSGLLGRILEGVQADADVRVVLPSGFSPISVARYGNERMRKSLRDMGWFLRYVGYAVVAGDPSILAVNTRGLRDVLEKGCSLAATNVALQEMRAAAANLFRQEPEARELVIACFNVLLKELAVPTPSTRQRLGSPENQGLQLPATYALAAETPQRFVMKPGLSGREKAEVIRAAYRQVFERDIVKGYSQVISPVEATQTAQGQLPMREFIRCLGRSKEYRQQFYGRFSNSRVVELAFRHFLGRGVSSIEEFRRYFAIVSDQGLAGLVDSLINTLEYGQVFGEETVPFLRDLGEEAQESAGWGSNRKLFRFSAPFEGAPQYITLYASYRQSLPDQHVYGGGNDPLGLNFGAIFPSGTASVATRPAPFGYDTRRILVGNGMAQPGQMDSPQFRASSPRRVGPRVVRLQQIATGGSSVPRRRGQPSVRNTEASTQGVIRAVYVQVLGTVGYAGEQLTVEEIKLENGDISLRDFIRQVARSKAFRKRYWSGLYITKAIEVMHRRLLGRPTFGRWEINSYFDTAARQGFYGVIDAMLESREYNDAFGQDTVPYERFISPADLNARRVPSLRQPFEATEVADFTPVRRPEVAPTTSFRGSGDLTARNLADRRRVRVVGGWRASISGGETPSGRLEAQAPQGLRQPPSPTRRWSTPRATPGLSVPAWRSTPSAAPGSTSYQSPPQAGGWTSRVGGASPGFSPAKGPDAAMAGALGGARPQGFSRRGGLGQPITWRPDAGETALQEVIEASYRQLLNRVPLASERLNDAESQLRDGQLSVSEFIGLIAASDLFQQRLIRMAPLRAASAAFLALLGRAGQPKEVSHFLATRAKQGQMTALDGILDSQEYSDRFGRDTVPYLRGLDTENGIPITTVNRTAALYAGNAGLTPPTKGAI